MVDTYDGLLSYDNLDAVISALEAVENRECSTENLRNLLLNVLRVKPNVVDTLINSMDVNDFYGFLVVTCIFLNDFLLTHL